VGWLGESYLAADRRDDRAVVVKLIAPERANLARRRVGSLRAALQRSDLEHPGLVPRLAVVDDGDTVAVVSEYIPGPSLDFVLSRVQDPLSAGLVLRMLDLALRALAQAHSRGVVHLDLRPSNLLFSPAAGVDVAVVSDLGIARVFPPPAEAGRALVASGPYGDCWAPELVAAPADADPRADIFALGVLLHRLLTGRMPGQGGVSGPTAGFLSRLLVPDPMLRLGDVERVRTDLEMLAAEQAGCLGANRAGEGPRPEPSPELGPTILPRVPTASSLPGPASPPQRSAAAPACPSPPSPPELTQRRPSVGQRPRAPTDTGAPRPAPRPPPTQSTARPPTRGRAALAGLTLLIALGLSTLILVAALMAGRYGQPLVTVAVVGCSLWVYLDTKRLAITRRPHDPTWSNMSSAGWTAAVLLLWLVGFPAYLVKRREVARTLQEAGAAAPGIPLSALPGAALLAVLGLVGAVATWPASSPNGRPNQKPDVLMAAAMPEPGYQPPSGVLGRATPSRVRELLTDIGFSQQRVTRQLGELLWRRWMAVGPGLDYVNHHRALGNIDCTVHTASRAGGALVALEVGTTLRLAQGPPDGQASPEQRRALLMAPLSLVEDEAVREAAVRLLARKLRPGADMLTDAQDVARGFGIRVSVGSVGEEATVVYVIAPNHPGAEREELVEHVTRREYETFLAAREQDRPDVDTSSPMGVTPRQRLALGKWHSRWCYWAPQGVGPGDSLRSLAGRDGMTFRWECLVSGFSDFSFRCSVEAPGSTDFRVMQQALSRAHATGRRRIALGTRLRPKVRPQTIYCARGSSVPTLSFPDGDPADIVEVIPPPP